VKATPGVASHLLAFAATLMMLTLTGSARGSPTTAPPAASESSARTEHDGQHDFDFEIGSWKTHVSRLQHPLTGSTTWTQYDGTTVVHKVWDGRANLLELEVDGPAGHLELLSFRLYNPESHQWGLNVASSRTGVLGVPTIGEFNNGRGEFFDQETFNDRAILVRFVISDITAISCHFEQAFFRRRRQDLGSELDRGRHSHEGRKVTDS
jgi:hypothetical protein